MRVLVLLGLVCLMACGGKLVPSDDAMVGDPGASTPALPSSGASAGASSGGVSSSSSSSGSASSVSAGSDSSSASVSTGASAKSTDCSPAQMTTEDFGVIDVSKLGCTCEFTSDCEAGALCVQFGGLAEPRCSHVTQVCDLVDCGGTTCIPFYGSQWAQPECI